MESLFILFEMEKKIYRCEDRGKADYGWLKANYSFSFANYYNPKNIHFGLLRVLNDDIISPRMGFGTHPHDNMEIITIPLSGSLKHEDSMGNGSVISTGEVQVMSAGTGITHSEFNASDKEELSLFQIWIFPKEKGLKPRYDQKAFETLPNSTTLLVSPDGRKDSLWINQDAFISRVKLSKGKQINYQLYSEKNGLYLMVIDGQLKTNGTTLNKRDAISFKNINSIDFSALEDVDLLILEIPI